MDDFGHFISLNAMSHFSHNTGTKYLGFAVKEISLNELIMSWKMHYRWDPVQPVALCMNRSPGHHRADIWRQQNNQTMFTSIASKNVESLTATS